MQLFDVAVKIRSVSLYNDGVRGSASHRSGSCHFTEPFPLEVPGLDREECVVRWQVSGGSRVVHRGALRQQRLPRAQTDSGHYHLLSAPLASGQEHLTLPVVTKCCRTAGSKVKYSLS